MIPLLSEAFFPLPSRTAVIARSVTILFQSSCIPPLVTTVVWFIFETHSSEITPKLLDM